jgi:hypothetical protein
MLMRMRKLNNRRVFMGRTESGDFALIFHILDKSAVKGHRIRRTQLLLSPEAIEAVVGMYFYHVGKGNSNEKSSNRN